MPDPRVDFILWRETKGGDELSARHSEGLLDAFMRGYRLMGLTCYSGNWVEVYVDQIAFRFPCAVSRIPGEFTVNLLHELTHIYAPEWGEDEVDRAVESLCRL